MTVEELIKKLQKMPQDADVISGGEDYPGPVRSISIRKKDRFDGYYSPSFTARRRDCIVVIHGGI